MAKRQREPTIDWARGVASVLMIEGHAFHGWISPDAKQGAAYQLTRVVATLPLPAFMVLAGTAVAYRARASKARHESARSLRWALCRRGLQVMAAGYAVNAAYALMDGADSWLTLLRADVLQVIGLSLCALGGCVGGGGQPVQVRNFGLRAACLGVAIALTCPWLSHAWQAPPVWLQPPVGLFIDVPAVTQMPFVPLFAWASAGLMAGLWLTADGGPGALRSQTRRLWVLVALGLGLTWTGRIATDAVVSALGGPLTRSHPAVVPNVVEYAGRGLVVLGMGPLLVALLSERLRTPFRDFGRASLWAYVCHIPFCYGALGAPLRGQLTMTEATPLVLLLIGASYAVVKLRLKLAAAGARAPALRPAAS